MKPFEKFKKLKKWQKVLIIAGSIILVGSLTPNPLMTGRIFGWILFAGFALWALSKISNPSK